jgi:hypothetical protein
VERVLGRPVNDRRVTLGFEVPDRVDLTVGRTEDSGFGDTELSLDALVPQMAPASTVANALQLDLLHRKTSATILETLDREARRLTHRFTSLEDDLGRAVAESEAGLMEALATYAGGGVGPI